MGKTLLGAVAVAVVLSPAAGLAQRPRAATYITDEEVKIVNALPGIDRTIRVVDIGSESFAVGIIHRGATGGAARGAGAGGGAARGAASGGGAGAGGGAAAGSGAGVGAGRGAAVPCGEPSTAPLDGATPGTISHDDQTEGYYIVSGGGTLVTGGHIVNGTKSSPEGEVTKILNGPSCSGSTVGADVVKRVVKTGDIVIIPAGVPHGWADIPDHVDYLSFRPSARVLEAGYTNPAIKK
jgi:mannose-6-phosphate isomerase-like protein (cupin superfamily)